MLQGHQNGKKLKTCLTDQLIMNSLFGSGRQQCSASVYQQCKKQWMYPNIQQPNLSYWAIN